MERGAYSIHQLTPNMFDLCPFVNKYTIPKKYVMRHYESFFDFAKEVEDDGNVGNICVTSLKNRVMPYIRYATGDKGKWVDKKCGCGNRNPILEVCNGRDNDWIRKRNDELLHPYALLEMINEINMKTDDCIIQYQLIQKELDFFQYSLVVKKDTDRECLEKELCLMTAERIQQEFNLEIRYYEHLMPDIKTGKIAAFYSEVKKNSEN